MRIYVNVNCQRWQAWQVRYTLPTVPALVPRLHWFYSPRADRWPSREGHQILSVHLWNQSDTCVCSPIQDETFFVPSKKFQMIWILLHCMYRRLHDRARGVATSCGGVDPQDTRRSRSSGTGARLCLPPLHVTFYLKSDFLKSDSDYKCLYIINL